MVTEEREMCGRIVLVPGCGPLEALALEAVGGGECWKVWKSEAMWTEVWGLTLGDRVEQG